MIEVSPEHYDPFSLIYNQAKRTVYTYDDMNRLTKKEFVGTERITQKEYRYDLAGNVIKEIDGLGNITEYKYNLANQVVEMLDPESKERGLSYTIKYEYDALGRLVGEITPQSNNLTNSTYYSKTIYEYNNANYLTTTKVKKNIADSEPART